MILECPSCLSHFLATHPGEASCPVCKHSFVVSPSPSPSSEPSPPLPSPQNSLEPPLPSPPPPSSRISSRRRLEPPPKPLAPPLPDAASCALHPTQAANGLCSRCGNFLCHLCQGWIRNEPICSSCYERISSDLPYLLWEDPEALNHESSKFFRSAQKLMLSPQATFRRLPIDGGLLRPALFYFIASVLLVSGFFPLILLASFSSSAVVFTGALLFVVIYLPSVLFTWVLYSGFLHLSLFFLRSANQPLEATLRAVAYSSAPFLLGVFPFCGLYIASFWMMFVTLPLALSSAHRISLGRAFLAIYLPVLALSAVSVVFSAIF